MKTTDYSFTGGFPLDQDGLDFSQTAIKEALAAFFFDAGAVPVIISGMQYSFTGGTTHNLTAGHFYYDGEIYPCTAASFSVVPINTQIGVQIVPSTTGVVVFEDGFSKNVFIEKPAVFTSVPLVPGTNQIAWTSFKTWHEYMGARGREGWNSLAVNAFDVTGTLYYRRNVLTNMLDLRGTLTLANAQSIANPTIYHLIDTLPVGYRPTNTASFAALVRYHSTAYILDSTSNNYILQLNCELTSAGLFNVGLIRPEAAITTYNIHITSSIPLD